MSDPLMEAACREGMILLRAHTAHVVKTVVKGGATGPAATGIEEGFLKAWDPIVKAVESLAGSKVTRASIILAGDHPVQRVTLRMPKGTATFDPHAMLLGAVEAQNGTKYHLTIGLQAERLKAMVEAVEPAFDAVLAQVKADVANKVAKMMLDGEVVGRIKGRLAKKRELERLKAFEATKQYFRNLAGTLSKEEVTQAWDEVLCAQVMES